MPIMALEVTGHSIGYSSSLGAGPLSPAPQLGR
jgi:hypothetical protein